MKIPDLELIMDIAFSFEDLVVLNEKGMLNEGIDSLFEAVLYTCKTQGRRKVRKYFRKHGGEIRRENKRSPRKNP